MKDFPILKDPQVVLVHAEYNTGYVLDDTFNLYTGEEAQKKFKIFNNLEQAITYIKSILSIRKDIEMIVYNSNEEVVYYTRWKEKDNGP